MCDQIHVKAEDIFLLSAQKSKHFYLSKFTLCVPFTYMYINTPYNLYMYNIYIYISTIYSNVFYSAAVIGVYLGLLHALSEINVNNQIQVTSFALAKHIANGYM